MRHSQAIWYLDGFRADELSPSLRRRLDSHISECHSCAKRAEGAANLFAMLSAIPLQDGQGFEAAISSVRSRTLAAVRAEGRRRELPDRPRSWARGLWRFSAAAPVAVAMGIVMVVVLRPAAPPSTSPLVFEEDLDTPEPPLAALSEREEPKPEPLAPVATLDELGPERPVGPARPAPASTLREATSPAAARRAEVSGEFTIVRSGSEILIQWTENGGREHQIRKGPDPISVQVAGGEVVSGRIWADTEAHAAPGTVTYYLVD